jgi:hypothetical protein
MRSQRTAAEATVSRQRLGNYAFELSGCPFHIISGWTAEKTLPPRVNLFSAYFPFVSVYAYPLSLLGNGQVARQRLSKHVPTTKSSHATIKELLNESFLRGSYCIKIK